MLKIISILIVLVVGGLCIYAALLPAEMFIAREIFIQAQPSEIFPHINSSKKANDWMPWKDQDPQMKMEFVGPEEGLGSTSSWTSEGQMGVGKAEVIESIPDTSVKTQLTYIKPMNMSQTAEISLRPENSGTVVRWSVAGKSPFIARLVCIFMNMDKVVGGEFEKGLAKLKATVEK